MHGLCVDYAWIMRALFVDYTWIVMDCVWIMRGLCMHGLCVDHARIIHGFCMDDAWVMLHGLCTDYAWVMYGLCMEEEYAVVEQMTRRGICTRSMEDIHLIDITAPMCCVKVSQCAHLD
jgi:hypothetical protein